MKKWILIIVLVKLSAGNTFSQSFTVKDLVTVAHLAGKEVNNYMYKKNFIHDIQAEADTSSITSFIQKMKNRRTVIDTFKSINIYEKKAIKYFVLNTSSAEEYNEGRQLLAKEKYVYDTKKDLAASPEILFEKANITIECTQAKKDSFTIYTFTLQEKKIPDSVTYAEDLLQFTSKEYLTSYFGAANITDDLYYLSEKEIKPCSVLLVNTSLQALFVWDNDSGMNKLAYIMFSNELPTKTGKDKGKMEGVTNNWKFKCGIRWGMALRDMLRLNQMDFSIYGNKSDMAMMVKPEKTGDINFTKMAIVMGCGECEADEIFNQDELSALEAAKAKVPLKIADITLYP